MHICKHIHTHTYPYTSFILLKFPGIYVSSTYPSKPSIHPYVHHLTQWRTVTIRTGDSLLLSGTEPVTGGTLGPLPDVVLAGQTSPPPWQGVRGPALQRAHVHPRSPEEKGCEQAQSAGLGKIWCAVPPGTGTAGTVRIPLEKLARGTSPGWAGAWATPGRKAALSGKHPLLHRWPQRSLLRSCRGLPHILANSESFQ